MRQVFPDYYKDFQCVGGRCKHNCCIGWEIDIDPDTAAYYTNISGDLGHRLQKHISRESTPHFILGEHERCPFLNAQNLCDIILTLGEDHICQICTDHPRFRNELPDRLETGLGLCCEEAGRLILGKSSPTVLEADGPLDDEDDFISIRDQVIQQLQDRTHPISCRVASVLKLCDAAPPHADMGQWACFLLALERLDKNWTNILTDLRDNWTELDLIGFDQYMAGRQTEYEQFLVYLVYRHLANACDDIDLAARCSFAAFGYELLRHLGARIWSQTGQFSFEQQVELARLFSSELEYSEENMDAILDELVFTTEE